MRRSRLNIQTCNRDIPAMKRKFYEKFSKTLSKVIAEVLLPSMVSSSGVVCIAIQQYWPLATQPPNFAFIYRRHRGWNRNVNAAEDSCAFSGCGCSWAIDFHC